MAEAIPNESYASVKTLIVDASKELEQSKTLLVARGKALRLATWAIQDAEVEGARLVSEAKRAREDSQQAFRAQQAYVEKMAARVETLRGLIKQNLIDQHPNKSEAEAWLQGPQAKGHALGLDRSNFSIQVSRDGRYIGEVVRICPDRNNTIYTFAPYRCVEMKAIGPFDTVVEALDAAAGATPYEPDVHTDAAFGAGVTDIGFVPPDISPLAEIMQASIDNNNAASIQAEQAGEV